MSKRTSFSPSKAAKAALGDHGFVGHTPELLKSEAWRGRSIHLVRLLDFFELEHLAHAGKENGFLHATYVQLVAHGIARQYIVPAIAEGIARGLLAVTHEGGYRGSGRLDPSTYQLTYLTWKFIPATGPPQYLEPTNEWKSYAGAKLERKRKPHAFHGIKAPPPNGHDQTSRFRKVSKMKATKRERERQRYLEINTPTYGLKSATDRWSAYEQLILGKYRSGEDDDIDAAWKNRDRLH